MSDQLPDIPRIQRVISVLWPAFLVAGVATIVFFTVFDPQLMLQCGGFEGISRLGAYSVGFFLFWLITSASCLLSLYFGLPCSTVNKKRARN